MEMVAKIKSRYGQAREIYFDGHNRYEIKGESHYMRISHHPVTGHIDMIDFEGGPAVFVGSKIKDMGWSKDHRTIVKIEPSSSKDNGYFLYCE